jgi:hypothetical protein
MTSKRIVPRRQNKRGEAGQKVQAGESMTEGSGVRTDASKPESYKRSEQKDETDYSPSLPSREKIAKVLR